VAWDRSVPEPTEAGRVVRGVGRVVGGDSDQVSVATLAGFIGSIWNIAVHTGEGKIRP